MKKDKTPVEALIKDWVAKQITTIGNGLIEEVAAVKTITRTGWYGRKDEIYRITVMIDEYHPRTKLLTGRREQVIDLVVIKDKVYNRKTLEYNDKHKRKRKDTEW